MSATSPTSHTSSEARAVMLDIYREMPISRKVEIIEDANRTGRQLAMMGLRSRHPKESLERLRRRLVGMVLGEPLATTVYGSLEQTAVETSSPLRSERPRHDA